MSEENYNPQADEAAEAAAGAETAPASPAEEATAADTAGIEEQPVQEADQIIADGADDAGDAAMSDAAAEEPAAAEPAAEELAADSEPADSEPAAEQTEGDAVANAAAALGDTSEGDAEADYRRRLREFTRELKKQPGSWYIIQTYSSYENKVKTNLEMRAQTLEVEEYIYEVVVPIEQVVEVKDGKKKLVKRKLLPGYVLVRMDLNDRAWSVVRDTPGVTSFVGNEGNATVVKHRDVAKFLIPKTAPSEAGEAAPTNAEGETVVAMPEEQEKPKYAHDFQVGDAVTILSGALASVSASISEIDPETGKIQALVSIFGRETPVELTPDQIEKII